MIWTSLFQFRHCRISAFWETLSSIRAMDRMNEWMQSIELISIFPQINGNLNKYDVYWFSWFLIAFQFRKLKIIYISRKSVVGEFNLYDHFPVYFTFKQNGVVWMIRIDWITIPFIFYGRYLIGKLFCLKIILEGKVAMVKYSIDNILFQKKNNYNWILYQTVHTTMVCFWNEIFEKKWFTFVIRNFCVAFLIQRSHSRAIFIQTILMHMNFVILWFSFVAPITILFAWNFIVRKSKMCGAPFINKHRVNESFGAGPLKRFLHCATAFGDWFSQRNICCAFFLFLLLLFESKFAW